jgi:hypothetical protein
MFRGGLGAEELVVREFVEAPQLGAVEAEFVIEADHLAIDDPLVEIAFAFPGGDGLEVVELDAEAGLEKRARHPCGREAEQAAGVFDVAVDQRTEVLRGAG